MALFQVFFEKKGMFIERSMERPALEEKNCEDRMLFLKNLLQLSLAEVEDSTGGAFDRVDTAHETEWEAAVAANSEAFRIWFESVDGRALTERYLADYSDEDMEAGRGIETLVRAFRSTLVH